MNTFIKSWRRDLSALFLSFCSFIFFRAVWRTLLVSVCLDFYFIVCHKWMNEHSMNKYTLLYFFPTFHISPSASWPALFNPTVGSWPASYHKYGFVVSFHMPGHFTPVEQHSPPHPLLPVLLSYLFRFFQYFSKSSFSRLLVNPPAAICSIWSECIWWKEQSVTQLQELLSFPSVHWNLTCRLGPPSIQGQWGKNILPLQVLKPENVALVGASRLSDTQWPRIYSYPSLLTDHPCAETKI